jgi:hypothetical protein
MYFFEYFLFKWVYHTYSFLGKISYFTSTKGNATDKCFTQHHLKPQAGVTTLGQWKDKEEEEAF